MEEKNIIPDTDTVLNITTEVKSLSDTPAYVQAITKGRRGSWPLISDSSSALLTSIQDLDKENTQLKKQNAELLEGHTSKSKIRRFLEDVFDHKISDKTLVDIRLQEVLTTLGRPAVYGSSKKQMRHVTPYKFIESLLKNHIKKAEDFDILYKTLKDTLSSLISKTTGICLILIEPNDDRILAKIINPIQNNYKKLTTEKHGASIEHHHYILIQHEDLVSDWQNKLITDFGYSEEDISELENLYSSKKTKYINYALTLIENNENRILAKNTYNIICETVSRMILTLFNERPLAAFPEEGNTLNYEIRLYNNPEAAANPKKNKFTVLDSYAIAKKIEDHEKLDLRIRIVNNEGDLVRSFVDNFWLLNHIVENYELYKDYQNNDPSDSEIKEQKNLTQKLDVLLKNYNNKRCKFIDRLQEKDYTIIDKENIDIKYPNDLGDMLYLLFDFKPLEKKVFVEDDEKSQSLIEVYNSSEKNQTNYYSIKEGKNYRDNQKIKKGDYNKFVTFRHTLSEKQQIEILADKTIEHLKIGLMGFDFFVNKILSIKDRFIQHITHNYLSDCTTDEEYDFFNLEFNGQLQATIAGGIFDTSEGYLSDESRVKDIGELTF